MRIFKSVLVMVVVTMAALAIGAAHAAEETLLIQLEADGNYRVWHTKGATNPTDDEVMALEDTARPEGGGVIETSAGRARAYETKNGVEIVFPAAVADKTLLLDRDACGGVKVWHSEGPTHLSNSQLEELVISALPAGGKNLKIGGLTAKAYTAKLGVLAVIWTPVGRR